MEQKPKKRGECLNGPRPCPWVSCKYHLIWEYIDGNTPDKAVLVKLGELEDTCTLDVADRGVQGLQEISKAMNIPVGSVFKMVNKFTGNQNKN